MSRLRSWLDDVLFWLLAIPLVLGMCVLGLFVEVDE